MSEERLREEYLRYLGDIVSYGESIIWKLDGMPFESFGRDADLRDLVIYRLQCISEATKNVLVLDKTLAARHPEIPWRSARDIGNRLRHDYANIDAELVWETVLSGKLRELITVAALEIARVAEMH